MMLDTCALLYLAGGSPRLSISTRDLLKETQCWFCAISGFEIAYKYQRGRLRLPSSPSSWLQRLSQTFSLKEFPLDIKLCLAAGALPPHHGDPCDRLIIAAAVQLDVPVVTTDRSFEQYGVTVLI